MFMRLLADRRDTKALVQQVSPGDDLSPNHDRRTRHVDRGRASYPAIGAGGADGETVALNSRVMMGDEEITSNVMCDDNRQGGLTRKRDECHDRPGGCCPAPTAGWLA